MNDVSRTACLCGASLTPESLVKHFCEYYNERGRFGQRGWFVRGISMDSSPEIRRAMRQREMSASLEIYDAMQRHGEVAREP